MDVEEYAKIGREFGVAVERIEQTLKKVDENVPAEDWADIFSTVVSSFTQVDTDVAIEALSKTREMVSPKERTIAFLAVLKRHYTLLNSLTVTTTRNMKILEISFG